MKLGSSAILPHLISNGETPITPGGHRPYMGHSVSWALRDPFLHPRRGRHIALHEPLGPALWAEEGLQSQSSVGPVM